MILFSHHFALSNSTSAVSRCPCVSPSLLALESESAHRSDAGRATNQATLESMALTFGDDRRFSKATFVNRSVISQEDVP